MGVVETTPEGQKEKRKNNDKKKGLGFDPWRGLYLPSFCSLMVVWPPPDRPRGSLNHPQTGHVVALLAKIWSKGVTRVTPSLLFFEYF